MNRYLPPEVITVVENICGLGCERVNEIIDDLESGLPVMETRGLDTSEQRLVLQELKEIMAIYLQDHA